MRINIPDARDGRAADRAAASGYEGIPRSAQGASATRRPAANPVQAEPTLRRDPHLGLRFWVQLDHVQIAGFRECSGLSIETEMFEYAEGGVNTYTHKLPVRLKHTNIVLKRGLDYGQDLFRWYWQVARGQIRRQNISILIYNSRGETVKKWDVRNAYPCKWGGPNLSAEQGAIAVETLEIAHEGLLPTTTDLVGNGAGQNLSGASRSNRNR